MKSRKLYLSYLFAACFATILIASLFFIPRAYAYTREEKRLTPISGSDTSATPVTFSGHTVAQAFTVDLSMVMPSTQNEASFTKMGFAVAGLGEGWYEVGLGWSVIYTPYVREMWMRIEGNSAYSVITGDIYDNAGTGGNPPQDFYWIFEWLASNLLPYNLEDLLFKQVFTNPPVKQWDGGINSPRAIDRQKLTWVPTYGDVIDGTRTKTATATLTSKFNTHGVTSLTVTAQAQIYVEGDWTVINMQNPQLPPLRYSQHYLAGTYSLTFTVNPLVDAPPNPPTLDGTHSTSRAISNPYYVCAVDPDTDPSTGQGLDDVYYQINWDDGNTELLGPYDSGTSVLIYHTWNVARTYHVSVRAKDNYGLWGDALQDFPVDVSYNIAPTASNPHITPTVPITTDSLVGSYDYSDPNGDPQSGTEIRWYKNGALQSAYNDVLTVPASATTKGELWYFTVRPKDGIDFGTQQQSPTIMIINAAPAADNPRISPSSPRRVDTMTALYDYSDVDGDLESGTEIRWYRNGISQPTYNDQKTIPANVAWKGESWWFTVKPKDGSTFGNLQTAQPVTIGNTAPTILSASILPSVPYTNDNLNAYYVYFDADNDPESGSQIIWYKNGIYQPAYSNMFTLPASATTRGEQWLYYIRPKDGTAFGSAIPSAPVVIQNSVPTAFNVRIDPAYPTITENLVAKYDYSDADNDLQSGSEIRWYKNGVLQSAFNDQTTVPFTATHSGEKWNFTIRPKDGTAFGAMVASAPVEVGKMVYLSIGVPQAPLPGTDTDGTPRQPVTIWIDEVPYTLFGNQRINVSLTAGKPHKIEAEASFLKEEWMPGYYYIYRFQRWSDGSTANPTSITITENTTVYAYYLRSKYAII